MSEKCRCGWHGEGSHPCHTNAYRCRKPAEMRTHERLGYETYACEECWETFKEKADQCGAEGCTNVGKMRLNAPHWRFALAGYHMKISAQARWGCDECWEKFKAQEEE